MLVVPSTGCTSTAQQNAVTVEYQTLSGVVNVVDVARGVYDTLYKAGKVPQSLDDKVLPVYTQYQGVANSAVAFAKAQAAAAAAGVAPAVTADNPYIVALQDLVNQLINLFNQAPTLPAANKTANVSIVKNAGV